VAVVEHRRRAVESEPVEPEVLNPPPQIRQQEPQHFPPAAAQRNDITADAQNRTLLETLVRQLKARSRGRH